MDKVTGWIGQMQREIMDTEQAGLEECMEIRKNLGLVGDPLDVDCATAECNKHCQGGQR